jgi:hypothetical protein
MLSLCTCIFNDIVVHLTVLMLSLCTQKYMHIVTSRFTDVVTRHDTYRKFGSHCSILKLERCCRREFYWDIVLNIRSGEVEMDGKKRKHPMMNAASCKICDQVHGKGSGGTAASAKESMHKNWHCACQCKARTGILQRERVWCNAADMPPEECALCEDRDLASWLTRVECLSQFILECERNWSAHGHIHSKVLNKRQLISIKIEDTEKLKMFA